MWMSSRPVGIICVRSTPMLRDKEGFVDMSTAHLIRKLSGAPDLSEAAHICAEAFWQENRLYNYIFKDSGIQLTDFQLFFYIRLNITQNAGGTIFGLFEESNADYNATLNNRATLNSTHRGGRLIATITLAPIEAQTPSIYTMLTSGIFQWIFKLGLKSLFRAIDIGDKATAQSHMYNGVCDAEIMMVATLPSEQKRGFGKRLMDYVLNEAVHILTPSCAAKSIVIGLGTQLQRNINFYEKFGFKLTGSHTYFESSEDEIVNFVMKAMLPLAASNSS